MSVPRFLSCLLLITTFISCKNGIKKEDDGGAGYFSVKMYGADQYKLLHNQPYGLIKTVTLNGKTDSIPTNVEQVNWGDVLKVFFDTDISDKKFLDQYTFTEFGDDITRFDSHIYEAKDKKLFTQKLSITTSASTHRITSIYIETAKNGLWGSHTQKLLYVPAKNIMIQDQESSLVGERKDLKVEYRFL